MTILLTSNEPWGDVWFSKQHYAHELSCLGYSVYFINPPYPWKFKNLFSRYSRTTLVKKSLKVIDIQNFLPVRILPGLFLQVNDWLNCRSLSKIISEKDIIFWHFDPFRFVFISHFRAKRIFHVVDPYFHIWTNEILTKESDLIVLVDDYYSSYYPKEKSLLIGHGVSHEEFSLDPVEIDRIENEIGRDFLILVGTLTPDIDYNFLIELMTSIQRQLIIIGPKKSLSDADAALLEKLIALDNVMWIGQKHAKILRNYVSLASAGIIPYKAKMINNAHRTPLKALNYLAQNKLVISTKPQRLPDTLEKGILVSSSPMEIRKFISTRANNVVDETIPEFLKSHMNYKKFIQSIIKQLYNES